MGQCAFQLKKEDFFAYEAYASCGFAFDSCGCSGGKKNGDPFWIHVEQSSIERLEGWAHPPGAVSFGGI